MHCQKDACLVSFWLEPRANLLEVIVNCRSHVLNLIRGLVICLLKGFAFPALLLEVFLQFSNYPLTAGKILLHRQACQAYVNNPRSPTPAAWNLLWPSTLKDTVRERRPEERTILSVLPETQNGAVM